jgi:hypothetical protein
MRQSRRLTRASPHPASLWVQYGSPAGGDEEATGVVARRRGEQHQDYRGGLIAQVGGSGAEGAARPLA